jgi:hypothetical protein
VSVFPAHLQRETEFATSVKASMTASSELAGTPIDQLSVHTCRASRLKWLAYRKLCRNSQFAVCYNESYSVAGMHLLARE